MAELRRDLDPPGRMSDATGEAYWVYYKTVRNPADGRIDFLTLVRFRDGVATAVEH